MLDHTAIGVGVTVHNRHDTATETITHWRKMLPASARLVVVDDGSTVPFPAADLRLPGVGIAAAKNACLALLDGCEHIFLSDDDLYPISPEWWEPYCASPVPHLAYLFGGRIREQRDGWVAKTVFHGCLLYGRRCVLDRVGGMRTEFGQFGYEHVEWSRRIHNAGLTPHKYMDVVNSGRLWHSLDEESRAGRTTHASSMGPDRKTIAAANLPLLDRFTGTTDYVDYH